MIEDGAVFAVAFDDADGVFCLHGRFCVGERGRQSFEDGSEKSGSLITAWEGLISDELSRRYLFPQLLPLGARRCVHAYGRLFATAVVLSIYY